MRPSTSGGALRFCDHKRAARAVTRADSRGKPTQKILKNADFHPAGRCAFLITNAQRATYARFRGYNRPMRPPTQLLLVAVIAACLVANSAFAAAPAAPAAPVAPANQRSEWLVQVHAADAIGEVLMAVSPRAEAHVDELRRELGNVAAGEKPAPVTLPATKESQAAYRQLLDLVVAEVRRGGADQIDPALENLQARQLFAEMAALHSYNLRTFRRLGELREQSADLQRRLHAKGKPKGDATTRPAIETADGLAREAIAALKRPQRSPQWSAAREKMRNAIATARAQQSRGAAPAGPPPSGHAPPANGVVVDDPRWQPHYYGPGDQFGGWGDAMFGDAFIFRGGGGVYERSDTRVNTDFDTRTQGQSDRRINVNSDRRLNTHVDPRENF
jgi:hypothetical protein